MSDLLYQVKKSYEAYVFAKKAARAQFKEWVAEQVAPEREAFYNAIRKADEARDDFGKREVTRQELHEIGMNTKATKELYATLAKLGLLEGRNRD